MSNVTAVGEYDVYFEGRRTWRVRPTRETGVELSAAGDSRTSPGFSWMRRPCTRVTVARGGGVQWSTLRHNINGF